MKKQYTVIIRYTQDRDVFTQPFRVEAESPKEAAKNGLDEMLKDLYDGVYDEDEDDMISFEEFSKQEIEESEMAVEYVFEGGPVDFE